MIPMLSEVTRLFTMVVMLFNMCNSNDFNRKQCLTNWDQWLYPELQRAWEIKSGASVPYQEEKDVLNSNKED